MPLPSLFQNILRNIFPGFVVSLVALPLALGLALASGAPPIAGLISAIVGGVLVSLIGGSNVAIVGPGNGLVVVTLTAITTLGQGDMYGGYLYTLAAVVLSGLVIFALGLFRFGALSEYFPTAAVQGMLAAIGVIIMAKQLHVMLGVNDPGANAPLELLLAIPQSLARVFSGQIPTLAYVFGLSALLFLFAYPKLQWSGTKIIPAPILVVLASIGLGYLAEWNPEWIEPLQPAYLVAIPTDLAQSLAFPDFGQVSEPAFFSAVLSLTFIATVESLLSMKAVDRLDPLKRRTNVNQGLKAIGIATVVSGLLGGLNVVKVIARSSVNVNQGASHRASNFFHSIFLLAFVLFFAGQLRHIPLSVLAAILVYTGYKLCAPRVFKNMALVGWEQLIIFVVTLLITLLTNLITGIIIGVMVTLISQLRAMGRVEVFLENLFKPNTLLYEEDQEQYHLSVKAYSNFLNFIGIKQKLDTLPRNAKVIVDFSLVQFIDYTVLDQLQNYHFNFKATGGDLEIIGMDHLSSTSSHPLSTKVPTARQLKAPKYPGQPSRRQRTMRLFAKKMDWQFNEASDFKSEHFGRFQYFGIRKIEYIRNKMQGWNGQVSVALADVYFAEGAYTAEQHLQSTMVELFLPQGLPTFVLNKENLLDRVANLTGFQDIRFEMHPDFSHRFNLRGDEPEAIRQFFSAELIAFFEANKEYHLESNGKGLLIFEKERLSTISEIKQLVSFANRLAQILNSKL